MKSERGQSLIEATLVLLLFFTMLLGVIDCGQVVLAHQSLLERVRSAVRQGVVRPWDGGDEVVNMVLYGQTQEPHMTTPGFLGLTRANVQVRYQRPTPERPDDETLSVAIVNFEYRFFSPWIGKALVNPRPVLVSSPMAYRAAWAQAGTHVQWH